MLLDEPTNYLDIEARYWLKNYLKVLALFAKFSGPKLGA